MCIIIVGRRAIGDIITARRHHMRVFGVVRIQGRYRSLRVGRHANTRRDVVIGIIHSQTGTGFSKAVR